MEKVRSEKLTVSYKKLLQYFAQLAPTYRDWCLISRAGGAPGKQAMGLDASYGTKGRLCCLIPGLNHAQTCNEWKWLVFYCSRVTERKLFPRRPANSGVF